MTKKETKKRAEVTAKTDKTTPVSKEPSPFRKIILSRDTVQITIPSHVRDAALKFIGVEDVQMLKGYQAKIEWDESGHINVNFVKRETS